VINGLPFWQGWPSVVALVTAITFAMMRLSPVDADALSRIQGFWAGRLLAISPGRRQR
jgi:hypothetical protein